MGGILSSFSKIDGIINPETSVPTEEKAESEPEVKLEATNDNTTEPTDITAKAPVESDVSVPKETESEVKPELNTVVSDKTEELKEEDIAKEILPKDIPKEGKKVEVEPVDVSRATDVIKKPARKKKIHQKA